MRHEHTLLEPAVHFEWRPAPWIWVQGKTGLALWREEESGDERRKENDGRGI